MALDIEVSKVDLNDTDKLFARDEKAERKERWEELTRPYGPWHIAASVFSAGVWFGMGKGIYELVQYFTN